MNNNNIQAILARLRDPKPDGKGGWWSFCPCHNDGAKRGRRSLHITEKGGKLLLYCFAGCKYEDIKHALGLDQRKQKHDQEPEVVYDYRDENGKLLYQVLRYPGKQFKQRRPDGAGGWIWNLKGVERTLYRLPELLAAVQAGEVIFIVEGEKDADNLARISLAATTCSGGAGKWESRFSDYLAGVNVVILPDNDEPGREHAEQVAKSLFGKARSVKLLELPGLSEKGDVSDWLQAGHSKEELLKLAQETPEWRPPNYPTGYSAAELVRMEFPEPNWCVPGLLPEGLTILAGKPKIGKSWLALNLAVAVANGGVTLGTDVEPGAVIYLALEDTPRRLKDRLLMVLNGDPAPENLYFFTAWPKLGDDGGLSLLEGEIKRLQPKLIVVDTLQKIRPDRKSNADIYATDYENTGLLKLLADRHGVTILVVHHLKKAAEIDPLDMVSGSTGLTAAADAIWVLTRERGQADAVLYTTGRDFEEKELALTFDSLSASWQVLGDAKEYALSQERKQILDAIRELGGGKPKEIAEFTGRPHGSVKHLLRKLEADGLVKSTDGTYTLQEELTVHPVHPVHPIHPIHSVHQGEWAVNNTVHSDERCKHIKDKPLKESVNAVNRVNEANKESNKEDDEGDQDDPRLVKKYYKDGEEWGVWQL